MSTILELALMSGGSYISTRGPINQYPTPANWTESIDRRKEDPQTGFEATSFQSPAEIVISYAGTYENGGPLSTNPDKQADAKLGAGFWHDQLGQAAAYYLQIKANPLNAGKTITLTGHSLGGGLASLIGVFFGVTTQTFDQAPFLAAKLQAVNLKAYLLAQGPGVIAPAVYQQLLEPLTRFIAAEDPNNFSANPADSFAMRKTLVTNLNVQGEFLSVDLPYKLAGRIGVSSDINDNTANISSGDLHSQALLAAYLQSRDTAPLNKTLGDVTFKLPELLKMLFDKNLFWFTSDRANTQNENFLDRLVRHETGVQGSFTADAMLTRFTKDLWKLAQDGGMTLSDGISGAPNLNALSRALTAFAMQFYYENSANATDTTKTLFKDVTGGVQFDMADVSNTFATAFQNGGKLNLSDAKGFDYAFKDFLKGSSFTDAERSLIQSALPTLRDWYVQAGASGLAETHNGEHNAFMLGGINSDALIGGAAADLLVGLGDNDILQGRGGNDTLLGGTGNDTYIYQTGDGRDIILDSDGSGSILMNGATLAGGAQFGDDRVSKDAQGHIYTKVGNSRLIVDGNIIIEGWSAGNLGLNMTGPVAFTNPANTLTWPNTPASAGTSGPTIYGDRKPADTDPAQAGVQTGIDALGNLLVTAELEADRIDTLYDSTGNDRIEAGGGADTVIANQGGNDSISLGAGQDWGFGGTGADVIEGGADTDVIVAEAGDDWLYADAQVDVSAAIAQGNLPTGTGQRGDWLNGGQGDDVAIGGNGNDLLAGSGGADLLIGGAGDDDIWGDADIIAQDQGWTFGTATASATPASLRTPSGLQGVLQAANGAGDVIYAGAGDDYVKGGTGSDWVYGQAGDDNLNGDEGDDWLLGGAGRDIAYGGTEDDVIEGGADGDILVGEDGNDRLYADEQMDVAAAVAAGNSQTGTGQKGDWLNGGQGDDVLVGGAGNDVLTGSGGADLVIGGAGDDDIWADGDLTAQSHAWTVTMGNNVRTYNGSLGVLAAANGAGDVVYAGLGNDFVWGGAGADVLWGEDGNDQLVAGDGNDIAMGGAGIDHLYGEAGDDYLDGGAGADVLDGWAGQDILIGGAGDDALYGGEGQDIYIFNRGDGKDTVYDTLGENNVFRFGAGFSASDVTLRLGSLMLDLGGGDQIHIEGFDKGDALNSSAIGSFEFADGTTLTLAQLLERGFDIVGTEGDDVLVGTNVNDRIFGLGGNDKLTGNAGADYLDGGAGNDTLEAGAGDYVTDSNGVNALKLMDGTPAATSANGADLLLDYGAAGTLTVASALRGSMATISCSGDLLPRRNSVTLNRPQTIAANEEIFPCTA